MCCRPTPPVGGLLAGHAAGRAALGRGLGVASHSFTTGLNVVVHLHLLAALGAPDALLEWPVGQLLLWAELFPDTPGCEGGRAVVPEAPGWGLQPNLDALHRLNRPAPSAAGAMLPCIRSTTPT